MSEVTAGSTDRRAFLRKGLIAGVGVAAAAGLPGSALARTMRPASALTAGDVAILGGAAIAEALAVTTYSNIIDTAPFFKNLASDDQGYLRSARDEEMSHYLLEIGATKKPSPFKAFYYPKGMFTNAQTTLNTLVTLEDAFIAAYLVGVRRFSSDNLRVTAARIMGIESDHRTLARIVGPGVAAQDGGPIETITGIQGVAESVDPPNNNGYERTQGWTRIEQAVNALLPFVDQGHALA